MSLLLDTHILLRAVSDADRLPDQVRTRLDDPAETLVFSAASLWGERFTTIQIEADAVDGA